jgi:plastocyanin
MRILSIAAVLALVCAVRAQDSSAPAVKKEPAKLAGSITGKVCLAGDKAPKRKKVKTDADPVCADQYKDEPLLSDEVVTKDVGGENRLQWVAVYVSSKVEGKFETPKEAAEINQKGCRYEPHVLTIMVNQELKIKNSDPTMHNIHAMPQVNKEFNFGQAKADMFESKKFDQVEMAIKIKCDVHPWMLAYAFVFDHPFHAVTKDDGTFEIKNVPPGDHEVTFWHEKYGEQKVKVKVEDGKAAAADAKFESK